MADPLDNAIKPPTLLDIAASVVAQVMDPTNSLKIQTLVANTRLESTKDGIELQIKSVGVLVAKLAELVLGAINTADPAFDDIAKTAIASIVGERDLQVGGGKATSDDAAARILSNLTGTQGPIEPSTEPAKQYLDAVARMAVQGWLQGWVVECFSEALPIVGGIENFGMLEDALEKIMGIGRISRRVMTPYVDTTVVTPLEWAINKQFRPKILTFAQAARAWRGGFITEGEFQETYARLGYTDRLAQAMTAEAERRQSAEDYDLLIRVGRVNRDQALQFLREQGYDVASAENELDLPHIKRIAAFERAMANEAVSAFAAGRITRVELSDFINGATIDEQERAQLVELADAKRALRRQSLSPAEARACVKAEILTYADYRDALRRDGYDEDAVLALELLLRREIETKATKEELRQAAAEERAAERARRAERAALRQAEIERLRALRRRGLESDLERAAVRGLIPIARYTEILRDDFDLDTVDIMVELVENERQAYLAQQTAVETAMQTATRRGVNLGDLRAAVFAGTLTLPEFRARLDFLQFDKADADLLTSTLGAQLADRQAAQAARDQAATAAAQRSIDLGRFERLVRRGARSLTDYDQLLRSLGFDDVSRAAMAELVQLQIADDTAARQTAAAATVQAGARGLSLDQFRRAVVLGATTRDAYQSFLVSNGFTSDAVAALLAIVDDDVAEAAAARRRRTEAGTLPDARRVSLSTLADAVRLGVVAPAVYQQRLVAAGYTPDDVAIELALLTTEIADVQADRQQAATAAAALPDRGLALSTLARAVRAGVEPLDAYQARAIALGFDQATVATLTRVLADEATQARAARARRRTLAGETDLAGQTLGTLDDQVRAGTLAIADYGAALVAAGLAPDDVALLTALLVDELSTAGG